MKCPSCHTAHLVKSERQGFTIDYCPNCRGIWFERGELDKIVVKLDQLDLTEPAEKENHSEKISVENNGQSPIMKSIYEGKELHNLQSHQGKHHWIHRLFH